METAVVPDFLTIEEAARVLRIGRTTAYKQAHRWITSGSEGLPAEWVGGCVRVPRCKLEQRYNVRITVIPPPEPRPRAATKAEETAPIPDIPRPTGPSRRRKTGGIGQDGLPFAG